MEIVDLMMDILDICSVKKQASSLWLWHCCIVDLYYRIYTYDVLNTVCVFDGDYLLFQVFASCI